MPKRINLIEFRLTRYPIWSIIRLIFKFFLRYRLESRTDLSQIKSPLIVVSNHTSYLDPPILGSILPAGFGAYPFYFMTADRFLTARFLGGFLKSIGAFRARKKEGLEKSLIEPKKILREGRSVVCFPQGRIYPEFKIEDGRQGTAMLAIESGVPVLPLAILGISQPSWKNFFLRKYRVKVVVGQPFLLKEKLAQVQISPSRVPDGAKIIMLEIRKLME